MNPKFLGALGMLGAPFLLIGSAYFADNQGLTGFVYMTGWLGSLAGLSRLRASGESRFGRGIVYALFTTLALAQCWNLWTIVDPRNSSPFYQLLDMTWPLSNVLMLPFGLAVIRANRLLGWYRFVPLAAGLWLVFAMAIIALMGRTQVSMVVGGLYSTIAWALMGYVVFQSSRGLRPLFRSELVSA